MTDYEYTLPLTLENDTNLLLVYKTRPSDGSAGVAIDLTGYTASVDWLSGKTVVESISGDTATIDSPTEGRIVVAIPHSAVSQIYAKSVRFFRVIIVSGSVQQSIFSGKVKVGL